MLVTCSTNLENLGGGPLYELKFIHCQKALGGYIYINACKGLEHIYNKF